MNPENKSTALAVIEKLRCCSVNGAGCTCAAKCPCGCDGCGCKPGVAS